MNIKEGFSRLSPRAKLLIFLSLLALGIALLLFGGGADAERQPDGDADEEAYRRELCASIKSLCESVDGVSHVTVAVTLDGGFEYVYATDKNGKVVTVGSGSSASGVILCKKTPQIAGVGIVCRGGGDARVRSIIISLVCAAYGIGANRIFVTEAKK